MKASKVTQRLSGSSMIGLIATLAAAHLAPAYAQDAATAAVEGNNASTDIVVTAQKRAERLQDVPLAVTAVSADTLSNRQINDSASLVQAVPSLTFQQGATPTNSSFRIRGIGTALFGQGVEASVSTVVDGVVAVRQTQGFTDLADIERIEVLRGPQARCSARMLPPASSASRPRVRRANLKAEAK
ncbi:TonB-dependent receptor plug domain-containing protein [Sphingobium sp. Ant17]|uniref:TonB-dependent receptor plug domain-containing protein n=1 Tax=Sphingobium sp. Ant17 TaxID=1461752 RepID=UPI0004B39F8B|nr:Plug domain-containing protein [Sphingobium sp. Ant17]